MLHYADIKCITLCEKVITLCTSLLRYAKKLLRYAVIITLCGNYYVIRRNRRAHARCIGTLPSHNDTDRTHGRKKQEVNSSEPNDDAEKRTPWALSQNHLSCLCKSGWSTVIAMQDHPHLLHSSAAYRMHVYIVDRLFGSMFTNGSGRTADLLYAELVLYILLRIYPLQPGE